MPQRAREEAREVLGKPWEPHQFNNRQAGGILKYHKRDPAMPDHAVTVDYMLEHGWIVGDPSECALCINHLYDSVLEKTSRGVMVNHVFGGPTVMARL